MLKGSHHTESTILKMSEVQLGEKHHFYGKHHTKSTRDKIRKANKGHEVSKKTRQKISESTKGRKLSDGWKKKISIATSGKNNPMYGKKNITRTLLNKQRKGNFTHSDKTKMKISEALTGKYYIDITKEELKKMYETEKLSLHQISDKTGFSVTAIYDALHRFNISVRSISFAKIDWDFYKKHGCTRDQYPYGSGWTSKLKKQIAERDDYTCQLCHEILPDKGDIHHIDYDKWHNDSPNLIFLCNYCHGKTGGNRTFWELYFKQLQNERGFGEGQQNDNQTNIDHWN